MIVDAPSTDKGVQWKPFRAHEQQQQQQQQQPSSPLASSSSLLVFPPAQQEAQQRGRQAEWRISGVAIGIVGSQQSRTVRLPSANLDCGMVTQNTTDMPRFRVAERQQGSSMTVTVTTRKSKP
jgi:hypothetical protein